LKLVDERRIEHLSLETIQELDRLTLLYSDDLNQNFDTIFLSEERNLRCKNDERSEDTIGPFSDHPSQLQGVVNAIDSRDPQYFDPSDVLSTESNRQVEQATQGFGNEKYERDMNAIRSAFRTVEITLSDDKLYDLYKRSENAEDAVDIYYRESNTSMEVKDYGSRSNKNEISANDRNSSMYIPNSDNSRGIHNNHEYFPDPGPASVAIQSHPPERAAQPCVALGADGQVRLIAGSERQSGERPKPLTGDAPLESPSSGVITEVRGGADLSLADLPGRGGGGVDLVESLARGGVNRPGSAGAVGASQLTVSSEPLPPPSPLKTCSLCLYSPIAVSYGCAMEHSFCTRCLSGELGMFKVVLDQSKESPSYFPVLPSCILANSEHDGCCYTLTADEFHNSLTVLRQSLSQRELPQATYRRMRRNGRYLYAIEYRRTALGLVWCWSCSDLLDPLEYLNERWKVRSRNSGIVGIRSYASVTAGATGVTDDDDLQLEGEDAVLDECWVSSEHVHDTRLDCLRCMGSCCVLCHQSPSHRYGSCSEYIDVARSWLRWVHDVLEASHSTGRAARAKEVKAVLGSVLELECYRRARGRSCPTCSCYVEKVGGGWGDPGTCSSSGGRVIAALTRIRCRLY